MTPSVAQASLPVPAPQSQGGTAAPSHCSCLTAPCPWQWIQELPQQAPSLSWLCPPSPASSRSSLSRPHSSSRPSLYMETFSAVFTAEEFEQLTIAISEITFVVSAGQNKPYLPNWFTVFNFFLEEKGKAMPIVHYSVLKLLVWSPWVLCSSHGFVTF